MWICIRQKSTCWANINEGGLINIIHLRGNKMPDVFFKCIYTSYQLNLQETSQFCRIAEPFPKIPV